MSAGPEAHDLIASLIGNAITPTASSADPNATHVECVCCKANAPKFRKSQTWGVCFDCYFAECDVSNAAINTRSVTRFLGPGCPEFKRREEVRKKKEAEAKAKAEEQRLRREAEEAAMEAEDADEDELPPWLPPEANE